MRLSVFGVTCLKVLENKSNARYFMAYKKFDDYHESLQELYRLMPECGLATF